MGLSKVELYDDLVKHLVEHIESDGMKAPVEMLYPHVHASIASGPPTSAPFEIEGFKSIEFKQPRFMEEDEAMARCRVRRDRFPASQ